VLLQPCGIVVTRARAQAGSLTSRLQALGAVTVKNAVYALPANADEAQLAEVLSQHPLAPRQGLRAVARELAGVLTERFALT